MLIVIPLFVGEHEVGLAGQSQQRNLVEDRVEPESFDDVLNISLIFVAAGIFCRGEFYLDLLGGLEVEGLEEGDVCVIEVGAFALEECALFGGDANVGELWKVLDLNCEWWYCGYLRVTRTVHLLQKPFVSPAAQFHVRGPIREAVGHIYRVLEDLIFLFRIS